MFLINFLAVLAIPLAGLSGGSAHGGPITRRILIRDEAVVRIPVRARSAQAFEWVEKQGPNCLGTMAIRGAILSGQSGIDFTLGDRRRFRAKLTSDCRALDFYDGFYIEPVDRRLCAKRDVIRSRMGGVCRIQAFKELVSRPRR